MNKEKIKMKLIILLSLSILLTSCGVSKEDIDQATKICNKFNSDVKCIYNSPFNNDLFCQNGNYFKGYKNIKNIEDSK